MTQQQLLLKRFFDLLLALLLFIPVVILTLPLLLLSALDTKSNGLFMQERIGQYGKTFQMLKLRTLKPGQHVLGQLDASASAYGKWLRRHKLDELPQLWHVLTGAMSFVGPRPDVAGYADMLEGDDRIILTIKPGITGPATLKYKEEECLLAMQPDAELYNRTVIWPDKVEINKKYANNWSFYLDLKLIIKSII
ncbi:sugar transferase [Paucihalobacter sp.]|uniref:sugar transferase n=1 Tax=Paucihalobacter sp. TaxID=2850405 RepID=UPI002FE1ABF3